MSWEDREYASDDPNRLGRPGGDWQGMRPSFDNPFSWSVLLMRVAGIAVRVHVLFLIYVIVFVLRHGVGADKSMAVSYSFGIAMLSMACLFVIVLAHEFGHVLACRWSGGDANEILMWPLGGLAFCRPGPHWKSHLATVVGGPLVNVALCIVAGTMLFALTGRLWEVAVTNPLQPFAGLWEPEVSRSWAGIALLLVNVWSLLLLLFNLLPIFPLDGGRLVQVLLWPRIGWTRSMVYSVRAGYVGAILLGIYGAVINQWMLVGIALFGGITCYITQKQLQWTDSVLGVESDEYAMSVHQGGGDAGPARPTRKERAAERRAQQERQESEELDRVLKKIAEAGMGSLTRRERQLLKRATERKRQSP